MIGSKQGLEASVGLHNRSISECACTSLYVCIQLCLYFVCIYVSRSVEYWELSGTLVLVSRVRFPYGMLTRGNPLRLTNPHSLGGSSVKIRCRTGWRALGGCCQ